MVLSYFHFSFYLIILLIFYSHLLFQQFISLTFIFINLFARCFYSCNAEFAKLSVSILQIFSSQSLILHLHLLIGDKLNLSLINVYDWEH